MNLRKAARNKPCTIRLPGVCDGGGESTVLAHYRLAGHCGIGQKPIDLLAAFGCGPCHDVADGRRKSDLEWGFVRLCHAEGVMRTLDMVFGGKGGALDIDGVYWLIEHEADNGKGR